MSDTLATCPTCGLVRSEAFEGLDAPRGTPVHAQSMYVASNCRECWNAALSYMLKRDKERT